MKIDNGRHLVLPWRVHEIAADFELLDVWELAIRDESKDKLAKLFELISGNGLETPSPIVRKLVAIRSTLGRAFHWDEKVARAIPGCTESSLAQRIGDADRSRSRVVPGTPRSTPLGELEIVYQFEDETLLELSNATIHALIHLSWPPGQDARPRLAIYIKSRGLSSRLYMAAIEPFRQLFVYPAWTRHIARQWRATRADCVNELS
jgi:hypothetical protein